LPGFVGKKKHPDEKGKKVRAGFHARTGKKAGEGGRLRGGISGRKKNTKKKKVSDLGGKNLNFFAKSDREKI